MHLILDFVVAMAIAFGLTAGSALIVWAIERTPINWRMFVSPTLYWAWINETWPARQGAYYPGERRG